MNYCFTIILHTVFRVLIITWQSVQLQSKPSLKNDSAILKLPSSAFLRLTIKPDTISISK